MAKNNNCWNIRNKTRTKCMYIVIYRTTENHDRFKQTWMYNWKPKKKKSHLNLTLVRKFGIKQQFEHCCVLFAEYSTMVAELFSVTKNKQHLIFRTKQITIKQTSVVCASFNLKHQYRNTKVAKKNRHV